MALIGDSLEQAAQRLVDGQKTILAQWVKDHPMLTAQSGPGGHLQVVGWAQPGPRHIVTHRGSEFLDCPRAFFHVSFLISPPPPWTVDYPPVPDTTPVEGYEFDMKGTIVRHTGDPVRVWRLTGEIEYHKYTDTDYYVGVWPD